MIGMPGAVRLTGCASWSAEPSRLAASAPNQRPCRRREFRPHVPAALAAGGADETRLDVRQPNVVRPAVGADLDRVAASVVAAIDQHLTDAGFAQLADGEFGWG
jgi:hypothetical protein